MYLLIVNHGRVLVFTDSSMRGVWVLTLGVFSGKSSHGDRIHMLLSLLEVQKCKGRENAVCVYSY